MTLPESMTAVGEALDSGLTLPSSWYTDERYFQLEQDRIFARTWHYVAHANALSKSGDYVTAEIGDVPVIITRDESGALCGLINVCRHRAHEVATGAGNCRVLQCRYHGWTYNLDGTLRKAPRADREGDHNPEALALVSARVARWGPFVFVNLATEADPFIESLGSIPSLMRDYDFDFSALEPRKRIEYTVHANWKVYVENSLECYHCPIAHPALSGAVEMRPDVYRLEADNHVMTHMSRLRANARRKGETGPLVAPREGVPEFQFYYAWPNLMLAPSPNRLWFGTFRPLDAQRTLVVTDFYFEPGLSDELVEQSAAFSDQVLEEDRGLVESVQRGLRSNTIRHGRLLPESEALVRHFQRLVFEAVAGGSHERS